MILNRGPTHMVPIPTPTAQGLNDSTAKTSSCARTMVDHDGAPSVARGSRTVPTTLVRLAGAFSRWITIVLGSVEWCPRLVSASVRFVRPRYSANHALPAFKFFCQFTFWCFLYCSVALITAAYCLADMIREGRHTDGHIIAAVAVGAFFGLFTFAMTLTSWRLIFLNMTNIDMLKKSMYQLAIRVPQGTPSTEKYATITYPLSLQTQPPSSDRLETRVPNGHSRGVPGPNASPDLLLAEEQETSARDQLATRTFAVVRTERDENPWDRGWKRNWQDVMGTNVMDWLLPIRQSPCARHDIPESEYAMGPLVDAVKRRYGLDRLSSEGPRGIEMCSIGSGRRSHRDRPST